MKNKANLYNMEKEPTPIEETIIEPVIQPTKKSNKTIKISKKGIIVFRTEKEVESMIKDGWVIQE